MADNYLTGRATARWSATGVGTNAGVSVTKVAAAATRHIVTGIQFSGDAAAVVTIESPALMVLYRKRFAAAFTGSETFDGLDAGTANQAVLVKISASTSNCEANIQGFSVTDKSA